MLENTKAYSGFAVDDLAKARQVYGETLGLEVTEFPAGLTLNLPGDRPASQPQAGLHASDLHHPQLRGPGRRLVHRPCGQCPLRS